jgi:hypothetical protein
MSQKNNPKKVGAYFSTKSIAKLDEEIKKILEEEHPDKDVEGFFNDGREFAGYSPPHTINGVPYDKLLEQKRKIQNENS